MGRLRPVRYRVALHSAAWSRTGWKTDIQALPTISLAMTHAATPRMSQRTMPPLKSSYRCAPGFTESARVTTTSRPSPHWRLTNLPSSPILPSHS
jgi:hypothetical protein